MRSPVSSRKSATHEVWLALQKITLQYFRELHERNQQWYLDDLFREWDLPKAALLRELAMTAGFKARSHPSAEDVGAIASAYISGIQSITDIARKLDLNAETVTTALELCGRGYGNAPFGISPYGGNRRVSDGKSSVPRKVTFAGQLSYRGKTYTLGSAYRGRNVQIQERGEQLLVTFPDRSPLFLSRRH